MPLFGAHLSVSGGYHKALLEARDRSCDTVQIFTKAPGQWSAKPITSEQADLFRDTLRRTGVRCPMAHNSYLINVASAEEALYRRSLEALVEEMGRAEQLGLSWLVMHPGSALDSNEDEALARIAGALDEVHRRCPDHKVQILLETTAGQGTNLGHRFEELAQILSLVAQPERLGICFDTCHVFAAGYPLAPLSEYESTMRQFDRLIGLHRIKAFHINDSQKGLGCRVDRHAHIGKGSMGLEPFRLLVNDPRFAEVPMVLETPKDETDEGHMDDVNLALLRRLKDEGDQRPVAVAG